ncbi:hypothetical protein KM1_179100 [Entamoeba histolytica HM-3:IMSS]|uniref:Ubiquitin-protein ligase e3c n=3 Tax=Entamoeba TaxID=5758 RepID=A0A175JXZ4_ENTHI|nr:hypothetical protein KM1_179100 [Entamoeba histolytica HM-3:IMSS]GAT98214.1 ubiquitin-protein ligase e3c [Entamoeba histolytica]
MNSPAGERRRNNKKTQQPRQQCYAIYFKPSVPQPVPKDQFQPFNEKKYQEFSKPTRRPISPLPPHYFTLN